MKGASQGRDEGGVTEEEKKGCHRGRDEGVSQGKRCRGRHIGIDEGGVTEEEKKRVSHRKR